MEFNFRPRTSPVAAKPAADDVVQEVAARPGYPRFQFFASVVFLAVMGFVLYITIRAQSLAGSLLSGIMVLISIASAVDASRRLLDARKFGDVRLAIMSPASVGGTLRASLRLPAAAEGADVVRAVLTCTRITYRERDAKELTDLVDLLDEERSFPVSAGQAEILFELKDGLPGTMLPGLQKTFDFPYCEWKLRIILEVPGVDFDRTYPVKVARAPVTRPAVPAGQSPDPAIATGSTRIPASVPVKTWGPALWVLIGCNLPPLVGVAFLDWSVVDIVVLYWIENVIVGLLNLPRLVAAEQYMKGARLTRDEFLLSKWLMIPFFIFHYSVFCIAHAVLLQNYFGIAGPGGAASSFASLLGSLLKDSAFLIAALALCVSHAWSHFRDFIAGGEHRNSSLMALMLRPYARIASVQLFVFIVGLLALQQGGAVPVLLVFIAAKTIVDVTMYIHDRKVFAKSREGSV